MLEFPDALIEKAAKALHAFEYGEHRADAHPDHNHWTWRGEGTSENDRDIWREFARAALAAVTPAIQAQALRDAAESPECRTQRDYEWLNERADRIHPKEDPDA